MLTLIRPLFPLALVVAASLIAATETRANEADDQFAVAAGHYDRQQWQPAVDEFRSFIERYPNDRRINECVFFLGEALRQLGKYAEARQQFQIYSSREWDGRRAPAALFGAGEAAYLAGDLVVAKADLTQFLQKYPGNPLNAYTLPYLGDIALSNGDLAAATDYFQKGLRQFSEGRPHDDCRFGLARALERQSKTQEAEKLYVALAEKYGCHLADAAQFHLGSLQYTAGRFDEALKSFTVFESRLAKSPWQPNARLGAGMVLLKLRRPDEAIKQFDAVTATPEVGDNTAQQAVRGKIEALQQTKDHAAIDSEAARFEKQFPKSPLIGDVQRMLARSLVERKEYAKAVAVLESAIAASPGQFLRQSGLENRYLLAVSYEGLGRYEEALAALLPVVDNAKGQLRSDAQLVQGTLLLGLKKYSEAVVPLEAMLAEKPAPDGEAKALGELAICYARLKQLDKAKQSYADLLKKHPTHAMLAPTTEHLAEAAYDANDTAWSKELSGRLATLGASAEYEHKGKLNLGWSQFKAGNLPEAAATFDQLLKGRPTAAVAAEASFVRGRILQEMGRNDDALAMYDAAVDRYPQSKHHGDALMAAARLREKLKQPDAAAALYQRLAKEHPQYANIDAALYEWAWVKQDLGQPAEAAALFERLRTECPKSDYAVKAACQLARRALDARDYAQANRLIDEVLLKTSNAPAGDKPDAKVREYAMFLRGEITAAKADWPKAREAFEALIREYPASPRRMRAEYWIGEAYYCQHDYAAAAKQFGRLAEQIKQNREPWMAAILLRQAESLAKQDLWNDAYQIAAKIEKDYPSFDKQYEVDYLMGRCLALRADFDGARRMYNKAIRSAVGAKTETAAMAQWMVGETYFHQKNYQTASREYQRLEILYAYPTWQAAALLQAGKCQQRLHDDKEAAKLFRRIVKAYPDTSFAKDAAKELARLEGDKSQR
jgi:cellulose synthase operon protein C